MKLRNKKRFPFIIFKRTNLWIVTGMLLCLALLSTSFGGSEALAGVFFSKSGKKLPIYCVQNDNKQIAISFDAAWGSDKTQQILDILKEQDIPATFFLVGMWVDKNQDLVKSIHAQGLEIGTHSNTHPDFTKLSTQQMSLELTTSVNKIESLTGQKVKLFRAPYGAYNNDVIRVAESQNLQTIQWDVDSLDWKGIDKNKIASNILTKVSSGSIILCHNNADHIVEALPAVISSLKARGYKFVRISDLLLKGDYNIDVTGRQVKK